MPWITQHFIATYIRTRPTRTNGESGGGHFKGVRYPFTANQDYWKQPRQFSQSIFNNKFLACTEVFKSGDGELSNASTSPSILLRLLRYALQRACAKYSTRYR